MRDQPNLEFLDKRRQRSENSKQAIIDAALSLLSEGQVAPTTKQIAVRAGVGTRTFFRHFGDLDALLYAVNAKIYSELAAVFSGGKRTGTLNQRIEALVKYRSDVFSKQACLIKSVEVMLWQSKMLRKNYAKAQSALRKDLEDWLPEVIELAEVEREAVDALTSFDYWERLREHQQLGAAETCDVLSKALKSILSGLAY